MASRYYNFRQGDRSELLADYLLSGIGITTPVRRQDDTGFDFYCNISDQEKGILTFGYSYIIQIKSSSVNQVEFGESDPTKWASHQVEWLFRNELPILFGFVDKTLQKIEIYDCSSFEFFKFKRVLPAKLIFKPRTNISNNNDIGKPNEKTIAGWNNNGCSGIECTVDLGLPIVTLENSDFDNDKILKEKKNLLRHPIEIQAANLRHFKQELPYLNWIVNNKTNNSIKQGWAYFTTSNPTENTINSSAESLISIGIHAKHHGKQKIIDAIKEMTGFIDQKKIPPEIKKNFREIFK